MTLNLLGTPGLDPLLDLFARTVLQKRRDQKAVDEYLRRLANWAGKIGTDWVDQYEGQSLNIIQAFVAPILLQNGRPGSLRNVLPQIPNHRLVIGGPAGAGKSTLVHYIAWLLSRPETGDEQGAGTLDETLGIAPLFPVRIELKHWNPDAPLFDWMLQREQGIYGPEWLKKKIATGAFILLDGLDEVPGQTANSRMLTDAIGAFTDALSANTPKRIRKVASPGVCHYILVTTRSTSYERHTLNTHGFAHATLQEFGVEQQRALLENYFCFWLGVSGDWQAAAADLFNYVQSDPSLRRLAGSPLALSQIAMLRYQKSALPAAGHELFDRVLRHLIRRRHETEFDRQPALAEAWLRALGYLAMAMSSGQCSALAADEAIEQLQGHTPAGLLPAQFLSEAVDRALLCRTQESGYEFAHDSFRHFLAAYVAQRDVGCFNILMMHKLDERWTETVASYAALSGTSSGLLPALVADGSETAMLVAARCLGPGKSGAPDISRSYVLKYLRQAAYVPGSQGVRAIIALSCIRPEGIGFILDRILSDEVMWNTWQNLRNLADPVAGFELREALLRRVEGADVSLGNRVRYAEALGVIGDARIGQMVVVTLARGKLRVGKYPVTRQEYALFCQETRRAYPSRDWPVDGASALDRPNYPVTKVTWDDAAAYCHWLGDTRKRSYRLPAESEWDWIACAGDSTRAFPWDGPYASDLANARVQRDGPVPIGLFPQGESPDGVADLMGNVWEWTSTAGRVGYIAKGGAFDTIEMDGPCQGQHVRLVRPAGSRDPNIGFRVVEEIYA